MCTQSAVLAVWHTINCAVAPDQTEPIVQTKSRLEDWGVVRGGALGLLIDFRGPEQLEAILRQAALPGIQMFGPRTAQSRNPLPKP